MLNIHGRQAEDWMLALPKLVEHLAMEWGLKSLEPLADLSYNYVLLGQQGDKEIILKISLDHGASRDEAAALRAFKGYGSIELLAELDGGECYMNCVKVKKWVI